LFLGFVAIPFIAGIHGENWLPTIAFGMIGVAGAALGSQLVFGSSDAERAARQRIANIEVKAEKEPAKA